MDFTTLEAASEWREATQGEPCPICKKPDWCSITGAEGTLEAAVCMRVESGNLRKNGGWLHQLDSFQTDHFQRNGQAKKTPSTIAETYDYCDASGKLIFQAVRMEPKGFRQRRPDGNGGWVWSVKGCEVLPYRLPELLQSSGTVFVVEGEKDAHSIESIGLVATCNASGSGKWKPGHAKHLAGRDVVILPDHDDAGRRHAEQVAVSLPSIAKTIKVIELPGLPDKGDVSDWLDSFGDAAEPETMAAKLQQIVDSAKDWEAAHTTDDAPQRETIPKFTLAELRAKFPRLNPPVVDGLFRRGESINLIASPKVGKSWLAYNLALSIISGRDWLDRFATTRGKVLLIDNELHPSTLAHRIPKVAKAKSLFPDDYENDLDILPLRGNLKSIGDLELLLADVEPGEYQTIILDAKYRFATAGESENDNASQAIFYNIIDRIAERAQAAIVMVHHSSKGEQSGKRITDVGSGGGAQSRAADCHIVMREHETEGVFVLAAAVRSFKPVQPLALKWDYPLWTPCDVDPGKLAGLKTAGEARQSEKDKQGIDAIVKALIDGPQTNKALQPMVGMGRERLARLLNAMVFEGQLLTKEITIRNNSCAEYRLPES